jgi:hypothetical protein
MMEAVTREQDKLSIELDLTCLGDRGETLPFRISLHADAVTQLIDDTFRGDRIYECFSIRRRGDIKRYLWVRLIEIAERIRERYRYAREDMDWLKDKCPFPAWDHALFLTWDEYLHEPALRPVLPGPSGTMANRIAAKFTLEVRFEALPCPIRSV